MKKHVLIVLTSHKELGSSGSPTGFWLEEFASPYYVFLDSGWRITVASPKGGEAPVDPKSASDEWRTESTQRLNADTSVQDILLKTKVVSELNPEDYDAIFFPGGHGPMWDLSSDKEVANLVSRAYQAGKIIGAVCHGPAALIGAVKSNGKPLVEGHKLTCFTNSEEEGVGLTKVVPFLLEEKLGQLGAIYKKGVDWEINVIKDANLITGQNPASSGATAGAVVDAFK